MTDTVGWQCTAAPAPPPTAWPTPAEYCASADLFCYEQSLICTQGECYRCRIAICNSVAEPLCALADRFMQGAVATSPDCTLPVLTAAVQLAFFVRQVLGNCVAASAGCVASGAESCSSGADGGHAAGFLLVLHLEQLQTRYVAAGAGCVAGGAGPRAGGADGGHAG